MSSTLILDTVKRKLLAFQRLPFFVLFLYRYLKLPYSIFTYLSQDIGVTVSAWAGSTPKSVARPDASATKRAVCEVLMRTDSPMAQK